MLIIWDTQTGVVIGRIDTTKYSTATMFHRDPKIITSIWNQHFYTYDILNGTQLCQGHIPSQFDEFGALWAHKDTLQFSTSSKNDGKTVINIFELQPTSTPPVHMLSSFSMPPQSGRFSFSPVSFHASFVTKREVAVFNIQDSKLLLEVKVPRFFTLVDTSQPSGENRNNKNSRSPCR